MLRRLSCYRKSRDTVSLDWMLQVDASNPWLRVPTRKEITVIEVLKVEYAL